MERYIIDIKPPALKNIWRARERRFLDFTAIYGFKLLGVFSSLFFFFLLLFIVYYLLFTANK
jgi:hypothetical protein